MSSPRSSNQFGDHIETLSLSAEWRSDGKIETVLGIVRTENTVQRAIAADPFVLSRLLTDMGNLRTWAIGQEIKGDKLSPDSWGRLVIARSETGEVIDMDPEKFWDGIYVWFRSRGVDYTDGGY